MAIVSHTFIVVWLVYLWATMRYSVQMFQQNSYRVERYNRWLKQSGEWHMHPNMVAVLSAVLFKVAPHWATLAVFGAWMLVIALAEFSIKYKLPVVYTMRVKRLIATRLLLAFAIVALVHIYAVEYTLTAMMLLTLDYWTIIANAIEQNCSVTLHQLEDGPPDRIIYYLLGHRRKPELISAFLSCLKQQLAQYPQIESYL